MEEPMKKGRKLDGEMDLEQYIVFLNTDLVINYQFNIDYILSDFY